MKVTTTELEGVVIIEPDVYHDPRGSFTVCFSDRDFRREVCDVQFVQDNESSSRRGVIRGLHYQLPPAAQGKLVRVVRGAILDVAVDMRRGSPTFGRHVAVELDGTNKRQLFIPRGFAHGFASLEEDTVVHYKCDNPHAPEFEVSIAFDDPQMGIDWRIPAEEMILSVRDAKNLPLSEARLFDYDEKLY